MKDLTWIVIGLDHYSPLGIIRSLGEIGINPVFISIGGRSKVTSKSKYISKYYDMSGEEEGLRILRENYYNMDPKPVLLTADDRTSHFIDMHYSELKDHFITFNARGEDGRITEFMNKGNILSIAERHGLNVLPTQMVDRGNIPDDLWYPVITKSMSPVVGGWKSDVYICENKEELRTAMEKIESPQVLIQHFVDKKNERCLDGFTWNGGKDLFIAIDSHYMYNIKGYYSPYHDVKNFDDPELFEKLRSMFEEIGFEGIFSLEFIIDQDDKEYFSEVNFRQSTWSRCSALCGMNLSTMWVDSMLTGKAPEKVEEIPEGFTAMTEPIDYNKRVLSGDIDLFTWLADFKSANCTYYYDEVDIEPYYEMVRNLDKLM